MTRRLPNKSSSSVVPRGRMGSRGRRLRQAQALLPPGESRSPQELAQPPMLHAADGLPRDQPVEACRRGGRHPRRGRLPERRRRHREEAGAAGRAPDRHAVGPGAPKNLWEGSTRFSRELFGPDALSKLLLPPSKAVDVVGESEIVKCSSPAVHASLFEDAQGRRTLITLNSTTRRVNGVRFEIANLKPGTVRTRFEADRTLRAQAGGFSDAFDSLQPHVYDLSAE